jgi:cystathionine beta-lyase/cystathionine gamma-synthase
MRKRTRVTHLPEVPVPADNRPLVAPIYQSVKFTFDDVGETHRYWARQREGFYYSRTSNPTLRQLELALADLQGRDACLVTASGVAAIATTLLGVLKAGDHVVYFAELYPPQLRAMAASIFNWGRIVSLFGALLSGAIAQRFGLVTIMYIGAATFAVAAALWWSLPETLPRATGHHAPAS